MEPEAQRLRRLLSVGRILTSELDQGRVLDRVLETAREITGARYAAMGVLNEQHTELERFVTSGVDVQTSRAIGNLPRGRGVLGVLIDHPEPLRLTDVGSHASSYGFPSGHPPMHSFLGVPVVIREQVWGNLYLTEKESGEFTEEDEEAVVILAEWAAIAIENARIYQLSERRRVKSESASRHLQVTRDVAVAIGEEVDLARILELVAKRGRALVGARSVVLWLRDEDELVVNAVAGHAVADLSGRRVSIAESESGRVLESRRPARITAGKADGYALIAQRMGVADGDTAVIVPMLHRGNAVGVLIALGAGSEREGFSDDDMQLLETFAVSAATALALAQGVESNRLRSALASAEAERTRWARELHDETLQSFAALRMLLTAVQRIEDPAKRREAVERAIGDTERGIENLRSLITELRPAALDELGLLAAIEALIDRHRDDGALIDSELHILQTANRGARLNPELESCAYRLLQEALTNVSKHAQATRVRVEVHESRSELRVEVQDDGAGFDERGSRSGFGLDGMHERVSLAGGRLTIASGEQGTTVAACLPVRASGGRAMREPSVSGGDPVPAAVNARARVLDPADLSRPVPGLEPAPPRAVEAGR